MKYYKYIDSNSSKANIISEYDYMKLSINEKWNYKVIEEDEDVISVADTLFDVGVGIAFSSVLDDIFDSTPDTDTPSIDTGDNFGGFNDGDFGGGGAGSDW